MLSSPRCGARTRRGSPCRSPAVAGKKRCRLHGGAAGSGAPLGNRNALKHGRYTRESKRVSRIFRALLGGQLNSLGIFDDPNVEEKADEFLASLKKK
jgi:glucans biosynthesis protein